MSSGAAARRGGVARRTSVTRATAIDCWIGAEKVKGVDTVHLVGATRITVTGP